MNILAVGDIVGNDGVRYAVHQFKSLLLREHVDFTVVNGENAADGKGLSAQAADALFGAGADVITLGNHAFAKKDVVSLLLNRPVIRPLNYPAGTVGYGCYVKTVKGKRIAVLNALGRVNILNVDCPFRAVDKKLRELNGEADITILDFHAEATSEKCAMGHYLDGRATCVFGTHTHVQTADECVLPGKTGYISDVGMTGPVNSILGVRKEIIVQRFLTQLPQRFLLAEGKQKLCGAVFEIDDKTNQCVNVKRIQV